VCFYFNKIAFVKLILIHLNINSSVQIIIDNTYLNRMIVTASDIILYYTNLTTFKALFYSILQIIVIVYLRRLYLNSEV